MKVDIADGAAAASANLQNLKVGLSTPARHSTSWRRAAMSAPSK
jgi:hypothetical protein